MNKLTVLSVLFLSSVSLAKSFPQADNVVDYAQSRPDSTIKENVVTETQVTRSVVVDGNVIEQTTQTSVQPSSTTVQIEAPAKSLLPAQIYDDSKDLEATMKLMGKNFKSLHQAEQLAMMAAPAAELSKWSSQAEALGVGGNAQDNEKYVQGMQHLRHLLADLEVAIHNQDEVTVRTIMNELGDTRKEYHHFFDVN